MDETMRGRVSLVTGATGGIGFETALGLARRGAAVVIVGRYAERGAMAIDRLRQLSGNPQVDFMRADLSIQAEVRRLAAEFVARHASLHVLVNNAGGLFMNRQVSADGIEMTLALNHLAPYLLTRLLLPVLRSSAPARVVNVASVAHVGLRLDFRRLHFGGWNGYGRSKLANLLFTYELARRLAGTGVTVNALHPGLVASDFGTNNRGLFPWVKPFVNMMAITNEAGAQTSVHVASAAALAGVTGCYFVKSRPVRSSAASYDQQAAARLWEASAAMTGLDLSETSAC